MENERQLLERARACDAEALSALYDHYAPRVYRYLYRRVGNAQLAEDLTGDVFVRLLTALRAERAWHTDFTGWLYRIAHNLAIDHYRQQTPSPLNEDEELAGDQDGPEELAAAWLSQQRLPDALRRLSPDQQQVLTLRFGEQLSTRQVAKMLRKSVGAIEALQHRGLAALRRLLGEP